MQVSVKIWKISLKSEQLADMCMVVLIASIIGKAYLCNFDESATSVLFDI